MQVCYCTVVFHMTKQTCGQLNSAMYLPHCCAASSVLEIITVYSVIT